MEVGALRQVTEEKIVTEEEEEGTATLAVEMVMLQVEVVFLAVEIDMVVVIDMVVEIDMVVVIDMVVERDMAVVVVKGMAGQGACRCRIQEITYSTCPVTLIVGTNITLICTIHV